MYNTSRPPTAHYRTKPSPQRSTALPGPSVGASGTVTLRVAGQLRHIGIGRTHNRTHVILLVQDLEVRVINAITGELLRELTIDTTTDYRPRR